MCLYGSSCNQVYMAHVTEILHEERYPSSIFQSFLCFSWFLITFLYSRLPLLYLPFPFFCLGPPLFSLSVSLLQCFIFFFLYFLSLTQSFFLNSCPPSPFLSSLILSSCMFISVFFYPNHFFSFHHLLSAQPNAYPKNFLRTRAPVHSVCEY
jgi:hypothetical protein